MSNTVLVSFYESPDIEEQPFDVLMPPSYFRMLCAGWVPDEQSAEVRPLEAGFDIERLAQEAGGWLRADVRERKTGRKLVLTADPAAALPA